MSKSTQKQKKLVIIYARKSRIKNDDAMEIERQIELCTKYANANDLEYIIISEEGSSEDWEGRKELQRMLSLLRTNLYDGVLVTDQDRIARDSVDFGLFKRLCREVGLYLYTLNKVYNFMNDDDDFITGIQAEIDNQFMRVTKRKLMRGRVQALGKGIYFGVAPYGYDKDKDKKLVPNPVESKVVQTIFDMLVNKGKNAVEISETLNLMGMKTRENKEFTNRSVYYIISNIVYTGKLEYQLKNQELIEVYDAHPAIITKDLFNAAQAMRLERRVVPQNIKRGKYMLSKLVKCSECLTTLSFCYHYTTKESARNLDKSKRQLYFLNCYSSLSSVKKQQLKKENRCKCTGIKASRIEEVVFKALEKQLSVLDNEIAILLEDGDDFFNGINDKIQAYNTRLSKLSEEKKKVQEGWSIGIFDADEAKEKIDEIKNQQLLVETKIKEIEKIDTSVEINRKNEMKEKILGLLSEDTLDAEKTNSTLREVIEQIYYYKEESDLSAINYYPDFKCSIIFK
ncbi:recombinase family protein [Bacillus sp. FJAT-22090]|uniref:recombinase family protein n=1 Tax=Bacillus sp. FJAT-22090 TaxID=1581038 RepID=UPI0021B30A3F|nr:recombinase family protein [Bacillus sp. FJAT-22090]